MAIIWQDTETTQCIQHAQLKTLLTRAERGGHSLKVNTSQSDTEEQTSYTLHKLTHSESFLYTSRIQFIFTEWIHIATISKFPGAFVLQCLTPSRKCLKICCLLFLVFTLERKARTNVNPKHRDLILIAGLRVTRDQQARLSLTLFTDRLMNVILPFL